MKTNYSTSAILNNRVINNYMLYLNDKMKELYTMDYFVSSQLHYITDDLGIKEYMVGGSVALVSKYNIPIRREFKDVDIIVVHGTIDKIRHKIIHSPFYEIVEEFRAYMDEYSKENEHIEIKTLKGFAVDIIEVPEEKFYDMLERSEKDLRIHYCPLIDILKTKNKWRRDKDLNDLAFIEQLFDNLNMDTISEEEEQEGVL